MKNVVEGCRRRDRRRHAGRGHRGQGAGRADPRDHRRQGRPHRPRRRARHRACGGAARRRSRRRVVEGAGAAGLAAIARRARALSRAGRSAPSLCGGNIDTHLLANVLVRELVRCGRIARLEIAAQDRPGALAAITAKFHECGVNIIEINHQPHLHPPAGQGHGDRGRVRGTRRPGDRHACRAARSGRIPRRARQLDWTSAQIDPASGQSPT